MSLCLTSLYCTFSTLFLLHFDIQVPFVFLYGAHMASNSDFEAYLRYTKTSENETQIFGWLVKEGQKLKQQKPRFFKLIKSQLSNHKDPSSPPTWTVSITDCAVGPGPRKHELVINLPTRRVSFFADSTKEFERWIIALKKASASNINIETFYRMGAAIGDGVNGEVYLGWDKATNEPVAIKTVPYEGDMMEENDPEAENEIRIVKSLDHPHLVKTYDVFRAQRENKVYIVMEYVAGGELHARVVGSEGSQITEGDAIRVARNILSAVIYLHDQGIVHRDIKLENVLCVDEDLHKPVQVKLADFGFSSKISGKNPCLSSAVGTGFYLAPEIIARRDYGASVDMWACGVLFYMTLSRQLPFFGTAEEEYYDNVLHQPLEFPDEEWADVSEDAKDFIRGLLEKDPDKRMSSSEAMQHRWVTDSDIPELSNESLDEQSEEEVEVPKSIFMRKKKTPAEILSKVRRAESEKA